MSKARDLANLLGGGTSGAITFGGTAAIRVPNGTTAERPTPAAGMIRYNTTTGFAEVYDGNQWAEFGAPPPSISTVTPSTYNGESGTTFTINGANFTADATVFFVTSGGTQVQAGSVVFVNSAQLTATTPQDFTVADEPLDVRVVQVGGQVTKLSAIDCGGVPAWNTASGTIATIFDQYGSYSPITTVSASDPDSGATITYSLVSGSLPAGTSLNTSTGAISGDPTDVVADTTSNFTLAATDNAGNQTQRAFSILVRKYSPAVVSNILAFYDATDSTFAYSSGSLVSSWSDLSGNGYHATQADVSRQPTRSATAFNNKPGVTFSSALRMWANVPTQDILTVVFAWRGLSMANSAIWQSGAINAGKDALFGYYKWLDTDGVGVNTFNSDNWGYSPATNDVTRAGGSYATVTVQKSNVKGVNTKIWAMGSQKSLSQVLGTTPDSLTVNNGFHLGGISEQAADVILLSLAVYAGPLSDTDRQNVESWMVNKYGIS